MKHIFVTGGSGFIGSHTVLKLLINGYKVTIIDSNVNSSPFVIKRIMAIIKNINAKYMNNLTFIKGDLRDYILLKKIFQNASENGLNIDAVIHFAGLKSVSESKTNPLKYWEYNVFGTINLLKIMHKFNCRNIIFSSSATVYGNKKNPPFKETYNLSPVNPYANTKVTIEKILKDISDSHADNWKIITLRYFNPIGAHSSGLIGEDPIGIPNNIFPTILNAFIKKEKLFVYGDDWPTADGTCIRDYIHIEDLAEGHVRSIEKLTSFKKGYYCFNLGTGNGTSVLDLINKFEEINKVKINYKISERRKGDTAILVADNSLALKKLEWIPKRDIYNMCKDGYKWIKKNPNGYNS